jgi:DNA-binding NarL/FixJ family response regulator
MGTNVAVGAPRRVVVAGDLGGVLDDDEFMVVGEAGDAEEALALLDELRPDVLLLDLSVADGDGLRLLEQSQGRFPATVVVAVSSGGEPAVIADVIDRGARAYVVKSADPQRLHVSVRRALTAASAVRPLT